MRKQHNFPDSVKGRAFVIKKIFIVLLISIVFLTGFVSNPSNKEHDSSISLDNFKRLNKIIITLLTPEIQKAVNKFYEPYISIEPTVMAYFGSDITDIAGDSDDTFYSVTVEVEPYVGPHISIGRDRVTLDISADGTVVVKRFKHLKNYDLPPNLQSLIKKPLP